MPEASAVAAIIWNAAHWGAENKTRLHRTWDWLSRPFRRRSRVLIVGLGGSGKSTLAKYLSGRFDWFRDPIWKYQQSSGREYYEQVADSKISMNVLPGQIQRFEQDWPMARQEIESAVYDGIIWVSAYGYNTVDRLTSITSSTGKTRLNEALDSHRLRELQLEKTFRVELLQSLTRCPKKVWLFDAILKQDLWYDEYDIATEYYRDLNNTNTNLKELLIPNNLNFKHEQIFASLIIANFRHSDSKIAKKTCGGYDFELQIESLDQMNKLIRSLIQWSQQK